MCIRDRFKPEEAINKLVDLAQLARKNGLLALEEQAGDIKDPFFKRGVLLVVDAMEAEKVRSLLEEDVYKRQVLQEHVFPYGRDNTVRSGNYS